MKITVKTDTNKIVIDEPELDPDMHSLAKLFRQLSLAMGYTEPTVDQFIWTEYSSLIDND